jgi:two-component system sensor histidine kinase AlgZ
MIATDSMSCKPTSPLARRLIRFISFSIVITAAIALIIGGPSAEWRQIAVGFLYGLVYTACIGGLAWVIMPHVGAYSMRMRLLAGWSLLILSMAIIAAAGFLVALGVFAALGVFPWAQYWMTFWGGLRFVTVISVVIGVTISLYESMKYRLRYEATQARLSSLESRLQPHFLFNTLNSISALIPENPEAAERMTERLAAVLRFSLDSTDRPTVSLEHELKIARDYLEIEKTRFGSRLNYSVDVPRDLLSGEVPPFSLQTLIENSVKYGGGEIRVSARNGDGRLVLNVWDSGRGFAKDAQIPPGHGLDNLRSRLAVLWGSRATLEFHREDSGTSVRISLPVGTAG